MRRRVVEAALCDATGATRVVRLCPRCGSAAHGAPRLVGSPWCVSISYADELALIAWGEAPLGIDVEPLGGPADDELAAWTRMEALLKATGRGVHADHVPALPTYSLDVPGHVATLAGEGRWRIVSLAGTEPRRPG